MKGEKGRKSGAVTGPLAPGQRWSLTRKWEVALRLVRGESMDQQIYWADSDSVGRIHAIQRLGNAK